MKDFIPFDISYLPLKITLTALKRAELPSFLGSTLRGVIGQSLYRCDRDAYEFLYENGKKCGGKQDIVKPYLIIPPEAHGIKTIVDQGETLSFEFLLLGNAVKYTSSLIAALQDVCRYGLGAQRYPFALLRVINSQDHRIVWQEGNYYGSGVNDLRIPNQMLPDVTSVVVGLRTPLRIRRGGQLVTSISFETVIRNVTKRMVGITERYGGWVDEEEIKRIQFLAAGVLMTKENLRLEHLERYSNRLQEKMDLSGLVGELQFEGNLDSFVPWLFAAQILHIGRNTTFGMGRIEVCFF